MVFTEDTIVAVASPPRGGARGIVRLSGPGVLDCLQPWIEADTDWQSLRRASVVSASIRLDEAERRISCELFLWPTKRSYTRQKTAEIHTIGSPPLLNRIVANLCSAGARLAKPGEFTMLAFLAGRLDLTQAEAVLGVIDAQNERQLDVALRQLAGGVSSHLQSLRDDLLNLLADLEAGLDFVEEDISFVSAEAAERRLTSAMELVDTAIQKMQLRATPSQVPTVVLVGEPNAGKSSLFNALLGDDAAIVSSMAGTTRDYIQLRTEFGGLPCDLVDTAGLDPLASQTASQSSAANPELSAQEMTESAAQRATLRLVCVDLSREATEEELRSVANRDEDTLVVGTKSDLSITSSVDCDVLVSSLPNGKDGRERLAGLVAERLALDSELSGEAVVTTAVRCRTSLHDCRTALCSAREICFAGAGDELIAAELRTALDAIGQVVGAVYTDDVLDRVFSRFCIGK